MVVGFVGGFVHHDDSAHQEVQLASHLRSQYPDGNVNVMIFENHRGSEAHQAILRLLDADHDGTLSEAERSKARIVLYGHSWGATEVVRLARTLEKERVPVLLTVQVDSVHKPGGDNRFIPANVAQAINFYQQDGLLHGQKEIVANDPSRTRILGNVLVDYKTNQVPLDGYPWYAKMFMKPHVEIESDPNVWNRVESLVKSSLSH